MNSKDISRVNETTEISEDSDWSGEDVALVIEKTNWSNIRLRLNRYTERRLKYMYWRGELNGLIPGGEEIEDFVNEAIRKYLNEPYKWKSRKGTLLKYLKLLVSTDINNWSELSENRLEIRANDVSSNDDYSNSNDLDISQIKDKQIVPEDIRLTWESDVKILLSELRKICSSKLVISIAQLIFGFDATLKPGEISQLLKIDIKEVRNAKKIYERALLELKKNKVTKERMEYIQLQNLKLNLIMPEMLEHKTKIESKIRTGEKK